MNVLETYPIQTLPKIVDSVPPGLSWENLDRFIAHTLQTGYLSFMTRVELLIQAEGVERDDAWRKGLER